MEGESAGFANSQEGSIADEYMQWLWMDMDWRRYDSSVAHGSEQKPFCTLPGTGAAAAAAMRLECPFASFVARTVL